jgi:hypothetical protein
MKVFLQNGGTLKFTSLLSDTISSRIYFFDNNIAVEEVADLYTWVK